MSLPLDLEGKLGRLSAEKQALLRRRLQDNKSANGPRAIHRRSMTEPRLLSFAQQQMWLIDQLTPGVSAYTVPSAVHIRGPLDVSALQRALDAIVGRHEVLRTLFLAVKGQPVALVLKKWSVEMPQVNLQELSAEQQNDKLATLLKNEAMRPFRLSKDLKLRTTLYRLAPTDYVLVHVTHHIAWDLGSKGIFYRELSELYSSYSEGREPSLPDPPLQYADYAAWQQEYLRDEVLQQLVSYWKVQLEAAPCSLELPTDHPRPPVQTLKGAKYPIALSPELLLQAQGFAQHTGVTLYMLLLSSFYAFLHCWTGATDISIGSPFTLRGKETEAVIGMFINTLVLRTQVEAERSFRDLLSRVRDTVLGAMTHQDLPLEKIVEAVRPPRDLSRNPLFQVNFRLQGSPRSRLLLPGLNIEPWDVIDNDSAKFDLALQLPSSPQVAGFMEYSTDLFEGSTISRMAENICALLQEVLVNPDKRLQDLDCVRNIRRS